MISHPAILALLIGSILVCFMLAYSSYYGVQILRRWDIQSGSELQLNLERRTYLISTIMSYAFGFQLISFFLFTFTADHLHTLFVGAMCAAGVLNVNGWGYPALLLKIINFLLAGLWLVVNHTDNRAYDYPLIKRKYGLLLFITPFVLAEAVFQGNFFLGLKPDIITSCCGTLFTPEKQGVPSALFAFPRLPMEIAFYGTMLLTFALGGSHIRNGKGGYLFSSSSTLTFLISGAAFMSFICLYFYELPTHHCPFCVLQKEYGYVGYPLYITFLAGAVAGLGVGVIEPFRKIKSLREIVPSLQKRLVFLALLSYGLFMAIVVYQMITSNLILGS